MSNAVGASGPIEGVPTEKTECTRVGPAQLPQSQHSKLHDLLKRHLKPLGVAQIMIGLQCLLLGTIEGIFTLSLNFKSILFSFYVGFPFWATMSFIVSGTLTILSTKKHTKLLIGINIGANTISTVLSLIGIVILLVNLIDIQLFECSQFSECSLAKFFTTSIVVLQMMVTCVELVISFSLSGLTYDVNGTDVSWVSALSCMIVSASEDPYQDLLTQPEDYEDLVPQNTDSVKHDP